MNLKKISKIRIAIYCLFLITKQKTYMHLKKDIFNILFKYFSLINLCFLYILSCVQIIYIYT